MNLSDADINRIIERVQLAVGEAAVAGETPSCGGERTLVLVPSFVPAPEKALASLCARFSDGMQVVFLSDASFKTGAIPNRLLNWSTQKNELIALLVQAEHAVLLAPETGMLTRMGNGEDTSGFGEALLRRILWGKPVEILLDFDPPTFRRGTYFAQLVEAVDTLSSMGIRFSTYQPVESASSGAYSLVTEQDIVDAKKRGQKSILCAKDAIVTPLARDTAKEMQINIEYA